MPEYRPLSHVGLYFLLCSYWLLTSSVPWFWPGLVQWNGAMIHLRIFIHIRIPFLLDHYSFNHLDVLFIFTTSTNITFYAFHVFWLANSIVTQFFSSFPVLFPFLNNIFVTFVLKVIVSLSFTDIHNTLSLSNWLSHTSIISLLILLGFIKRWSKFGP